MKKKTNKPPAHPPSRPPQQTKAENGAPKPPPWRLWSAWAGLAAVLLACIVWIFGHTYLVYTVTVRLCEHMDAGVPPEKRLPVFLAPIAFDGYVWNRHAEKLGENGQIRLRYTDFDNAPDGREVHWNSAFAWYLRGLGELHLALTGDKPGASLRKSIYLMSIWANPILLALAVVATGLLAARRFGPLAGAVLAVGMVGIPTFYEGFLPGYPDHHGLISYTLLGILLGLAWGGAGWVRGPGGRAILPAASYDQARRGMIFSALCGAAGLWISALSTAMVLAAVGVAAAATTPFYLKKGRAAELTYHPELWRTWALWGSGGALVFYLLEYFPQHFSWRLEVNHPLYVLAFLGGGMALFLWNKWWADGRRAPFPWAPLAVCGLVCALLPFAILVGGPAVYLVKDPFMARLYDNNIAELLPLLKRIEMGGLTWGVAVGWYPVLLLAAGLLQTSTRVDAGSKMVLAFLSIPIVLLMGMQFYQVRWGLLVGPLYAVLAAVLIPQLWRMVPDDRLSRLAGIVCGLSFGYLFLSPAFKNCFAITWQQYRAEPGKIPISPGEALALLHRQMAMAIQQDAGEQPVVLLSSPNSSCLLAAMGGFRTLGTLYWENAEGLKRAARLLNAQNDEETSALLRQYGVTHISLMTWENFIEPYFYILYPEAAPRASWGLSLPTLAGGPKGEEPRKTPQNSFGIRALFQNTIPPFMRPLIFPPNDLTKAMQQRVLLLRFAPGQGMAEARLHLAQFVRLVEDNPVQAEIELRDLLEDPAVGPLAAAELGILQITGKRFDAAAANFSRAADSPDPGFRHQLQGAVLRELPKNGESARAKELVVKISGREDALRDTLLDAAWFLATCPDLPVRDPGQAEGFLQRALAREQEPPPDPALVLLIRAAIAGARENYAEAAGLAAQALEKIPQAGSAAEPAERMRESFLRQEPWVPKTE